MSFRGTTTPGGCVSCRRLLTARRCGIGVECSDVRGYDVSGDVTGYNWAVCRLYEPLGSWLGYFGYNGYDSDWGTTTSTGR